MPLDDLLAALEREARVQRETLLTAAHADAERILAAARTRADAERASRLERQEREGRESAASGLAGVRLAARHDVLTARERFLGRIFDAAATKLDAAGTGSAYRSTLPDRLRLAVASVGDGPAEVRCAPVLAEAVRGALKEQPGIAVREDPGAGAGFRVFTQDGTIEVDGTLAGDLARRRAVLTLALLSAMDALA